MMKFLTTEVDLWLLNFNMIVKKADVCLLVVEFVDSLLILFN